MLCRSETVMTFHKTAKKVSIAVTIQTTCHEFVVPMMRRKIGDVTSTRARDVPLPIFFETRGPNEPPSIPPIAPAVPRIAKTKTLVFRIS